MHSLHLSLVQVITFYQIIYPYQYKLVIIKFFYYFFPSSTL